MIRIQNIRDKATQDDGFRVLVDPVWPGRVSRQKTVMNVWLRDLAPGLELYALFANGQIP